MIGALGAAVGAAAAGLRRGWRVRMVELGIDDVPRAWWRIGPTPWFPEPIDGYAFEDRSVAQLGSMGDFKLLHEGADVAPTIPESRHFVYAPMGASPFPREFARFAGRGLSSSGWADGYFYRGQRVAVAGSGLLALDTIAYLAHSGVTDVVLLCTTPALFTPTWAKEAYAGLRFELRTGVEIRALLGERDLGGVQLANGEELSVKALFLAGTPDATGLLTESISTSPTPAGLAAGVPYDDPWALWCDGERRVAALQDP